VVAKTHALDDGSVADVEAGDYALGRNSPNSFVVILPSSNARPVIAAGMP
jgi:hypothetical protein